MTMVRDSDESFLERIGAHWIRTIRGLADSLVQGLPLFQRELLAMSRRPRTFVLRVAFAIVLFLVALFYAAVSSGTSLLSASFGITGQGRAILQAIVWMLFLAIYLIGPASACGVLTEEKEKDSLFLLYLTKLGPWQVVLEKYFSRLVPLYALLLLSLPVLAFSYAFGGITTEMLGSAVYFLALTALQVTAMAVMCSAICRTTAKSFLLTYSILILLSLGPDLIDRLVFHDAGWNVIEQWESAAWQSKQPGWFNKTYEEQMTFGSGLSVTQNPALSRSTYMHLFCGPILFAEYTNGFLSWTDHTIVRLTVFHRRLPFRIHPVNLAGFPIIFSVLCCLLISRICVFHPRFLNTSAGLWSFPPLRLAQLRGLWSSKPSVLSTQVESKVTPEEGLPIAWREASKGYWSQPRHSLFLLLILQVPTVLLIFALTHIPTSDGISYLILAVWSVSTLLITVHASLLINKERSRQTWELLLATPITSSEIARQKFAGTWRLMLVCLIPLLTCVAFQAWWRSLLPIPIRIPADPPFDPVEYLVTSIACIAVYLPLIAWIALWMGMKYPHQSRATMAAMGGVGVLCLAPTLVMLVFMLLFAPMFYWTGIDFQSLLLANSSPVTMLVSLEFISLRQGNKLPYLPALFNLLMYGSLLVAIRRNVLERSDYLLGRKCDY